MTYEVRNLIDSLNENGIHVIADRAFDKIAFDFSEHDKKVAEEKDGQIADFKIKNKELDQMRKDWMEIAIKHSEKNKSLKKQIEDLEAIISDGKKPDISISENGVSIGCECGGYHLAKKRIEELEDRHQSDCIEINRLNVALEVMTEKYMKLREVHRL